MDLDALLYHYFGTAEIERLGDAAIEDGHQRLRVDFGTERDSGRRFAMWVLLHTLGDAPDPATAFKTEADRKAAEDYAWAARRIARR